MRPKRSGHICPIPMTCASKIRDLTVPKCVTSTVSLSARKIGEADLIRRSPLVLAAAPRHIVYASLECGLALPTSEESNIGHKSKPR